MATTQVLALRDWVLPVRICGPSLLAELADPHAELLALVWGPRFDREHAHGLLQGRSPLQPGVLQSVMDSADRFDRLAGEQQQRVRRFILRHRAQVLGWDNHACPGSC